MMDLITIFAAHEQGKRNGSIHFLVAFVLFLIFFKPIVWIMKVTGVFSLLQWMKLITPQGYFSFEAGFLYILALVALFAVISVVSYVCSEISDFFIDLGNK
ncbi:hypothetical protein [Viridibacillus arvi]|uniref:hypothetical protein n=1 Tax=Viridibacillus arvi TaxID=263475 RepID=UPI0034CF2B8E